MKIVVAGNYGAKNIGDEKILRGMLESLKFVAKDAQITVLSADPETTSKTYNVNSVQKLPAGIRSFFKTIFNPKIQTRKAIKECDYFILGGGGLFGSLSYHAYLIWGIQAFVAYLYNKPVIMYAQSLEPIKSPTKKMILRYLFKRAALISVRDKESKNVLRKLKINKEIHLIPDLSFRYPVSVFNVTKKNIMLVALRQMKSIKPLFKRNLTAFFNKIIKDTDYKIKFINLQIGKTDNDGLLHEEIIKGIKNQDRIEYVKKIENLDELAKMMAEAKVLLGMRLHSIIAAIKAKTPFIAINYSPKVKAFLKSSKLDEFVIEMEDVGLARLSYFFKKIQEDFPKIVNKLKDYDTQALNTLIGFEENVIKKIIK